MLSPSEQLAWTEAEARKIYRVLAVPPAERVLCVKEGRAVLVGDYGWGAPLAYPPERVGEFIDLEGLKDDYLLIWMARFLPGEVEFAAPKPDLKDVGGPYPNPYAVQKPKS